MGTQFLAGLMGGLSSGIAQNRQRQVEQEYRKALIEQSKLATKKLENELTLKEYQMKLAAADMANQPPPPFPELAKTQPISVQQPQQGLFGRIFNPQPPPPAAPTVPTSTQQSIPEIVSRGQMQAQMPEISPEQRRARGRDILEHMIYGTAPWREKEQIQGGYVGGRLTVPLPGGGSGTLVIDKKGNQMVIAPQPMEYDWKETQPTPGGPTMLQPIPKYPGGGMQYGGPQPFIKEQPKGETPQQAGQAQAIIGGLQDGMKFLDVVRDKQTGDINQKTIAGMTAPLMGRLGGMPGTQAREGLSLYRNAVDAIVRQRTGAAIRADEWPYYNSIYLPSYLDSPDLQRSKIDRLNRDLAGALMQTDPTKTKLDRSLSVRPGLPQRPALPSQQMTPAQAEQELIRRGYKKNAQGQWVR